MPKLTQTLPTFSIDQVKLALTEILNLIPSLTIRGIEPEASPKPGVEVDLVVSVSNGDKQFRLIVEAKRSGEPRFVRESVYYIQSVAAGFGPDAVPIFAAPYLSAASQNLCMQLGVSFLDLCGNCRIVFDTVFIQNLGNENAWADKRPLKSLFAVKASRAMRRMLGEPRRRWQVQDLAACSDISLALVSKVKHKLLSLEYAREDADGFYITQPESVLKDWARIYSLKANSQIECYERAPLNELELRLDAVCKENKWDYCLAGLSASEKVASHVRGITHGYAYVDDPNTVARKLGWQNVGYKGNFRLIKPGDRSVFWDLQDVDGLQIVSDIQMYLDLSCMGGRAADAAEVVLERRLRPAW